MNKIILLGGNPGDTGITIIRDLLCDHSEIGWIAGRETSVIKLLAHWLPYIATEQPFYLPRLTSLKFVTFRQRILDSFGDHTAIRQALNEFEETLADLTISIPRFGSFPLVRPLDAETRAGLLGTFVTKMFSASMVGTTYQYGCESTVSNMAYMTTAFSILPQAIMIVMLRHPVDLALSLAQQWGTDPVSAAYYVQTHLDYWQRIRDRVPATYCVTIKIETLCEHPKEVLNDLFATLKIPAEKNIIARAKHMTLPQLRDDILAQTLEHIQQILAQSCHDLNYDSC
jgi:hypothetical protein